MLDRLPKISLYTLALLIFAMIATVYSSLADPDFFWHLKAGQWMLENRKIPEHDPFLWTQSLTPWMNHEWFSDVILFALHKLGGGSLVSVLVGALFGGTLTLLYRFATRAAAPFQAVLLTCIVGAAVLPWAGCRPQSITYLLFSTFLIALLRFQQDLRTSGLWLLPFGMILWANLHGAFIIGIVLIGIFASMMSLEILWNSNAKAWRTSLKKISPLWLCLLASTLAACLTPYGPKLLIHPFKVMKLWIVPYIAEWQPAAFGQLSSAAFFALIGIWVMVQIYRIQKPTLFELALPVVFLGLGLSQLRQIPLAAIVLGASIAPHLHDVCSRLQDAMKSKFGSTPISRKVTQDLGPTQYLVNGVVAIAGLIAVVVLLQGKLERQLKVMDPMIGHSAIDLLAKNPQRGPIFNDYGYGGYLTWRLWPKQQAFIDGRADMYSDQFAKDYIEIIHGRPDWKSKFDHYKFNTVVISREGPLRQLLLSEGHFTEFFADDKTTILLRKIPFQ